jgi:signal peptidase II
MPEATLTISNPAVSALAPSRSSRALLLIAILAVSLGLDQATKWWAENHLDRNRVFSFANDMLRIQYAENPGAFLGLGGNLSASARFWLLTAVNGCFLVIIAGILIAKWHMPTGQFVALALLLSGGIGNLIDRTTQNGLVTDFLNVGIGPVRTGIFNVADMAIMAGAGLLFWLSFQQEETQDSGRETERQNQIAERH